MKTGIVFEGGAFRTIFSCGVMDAMLENKIMPDYMIGVSAGAAYGVSMASGQIGRNLKILIDYRNDKRYVGLSNMVHRDNRSLYGLNFTFDTIPNELVPYDYDASRVRTTITLSQPSSNAFSKGMESLKPPSR